MHIPTAREEMIFDSRRGNGRLGAGVQCRVSGTHSTPATGVRWRKANAYYCMYKCIKKKKTKQKAKKLGNKGVHVGPASRDRSQSSFIAWYETFQPLGPPT